MRVLFLVKTEKLNDHPFISLNRNQLKIHSIISRCLPNHLHFYRYFRDLNLLPDY